MALDVSDEASVREAVERTVQRFGGLTTLVNNAAP
jgi:NAD(P)-dependent dehydrogenase (short-subunit alcohol dehydrogenase family)